MVREGCGRGGWVSQGIVPSEAAMRAGGPASAFPHIPRPMLSGPLYPLLHAFCLPPELLFDYSASTVCVPGAAGLGCLPAPQAGAPGGKGPSVGDPHQLLSTTPPLTAGHPSFSGPPSLIFKKSFIYLAAPGLS